MKHEEDAKHHCSSKKPSYQVASVYVIKYEQECSLFQLPTRLHINTSCSKPQILNESFQICRYRRLLEVENKITKHRFPS